MSEAQLQSVSFLKKKIKGCLETECFVSSSPVEDPGTPNGKVGGQIVIV